ncbi:hypothetical protein PIB30_030959 [Stylosanthes scabra]|uniref:Retrotransposon gag domain-containing protein n=1 Tax=Stylosanthes scabra TaxID=79078 RepID=A0ABU6SBM7_9FABA|nr:hypothetical protein [Stylosanthes scabra]
MEKQITHQSEDNFPIFDGKDGYGWTICLERYWNARGTYEEQRFIEVEKGLRGKALRWFQLWKALNPSADLETFMLAFYHRYQLDMRPILPEICWNEVEEWEIEWEEFKARLNHRQEQQQQQSQIIQETTQFQSTTEQEIQAKIEEDQENFQTVEGEAKITDQDQIPNTAKQQLISKLNSKKNRSESQSITKNRERQDEDEVELDAPDSVDGDATDGFKDRRAGEGFELIKMVVAQRPPPEPPNLTSDGGDKQRSLAHEIDSTSPGDGDERLAERTPIATVGEGTASMLGGWRITQAIRRALLLQPPPLLAAVFPWNRDTVSVATAGNGAEDGAFSKGKVEDIINGGSNAKICVVAMVEDEAVVVGDEAVTAGGRDNHGFTDDKDDRRSVISGNLELWWEGSEGRGGTWRKMVEDKAAVVEYGPTVAAEARQSSSHGKR